ncbi:MAG: PKD domain-containing protein [Candidatus Cloacimonadota bacterium]|nr:PKD domain-containing protein [Candidatus Cloacimonadota bacterium]
MKKFLIIFFLTLVIFSCDRFEYEFYEPPIAHINVSVTQGYSPLEVTFFDVSELGSKPIEEWIWDFDGDGIPEQIYTSENNPDSVVFVYNTPDIYSAIIIIYDGKSTSTDTVCIEVLDVLSPLADFEYDQPDYYQLEINFTDLSSPGINPITIWEWDFNDDGIIDSYDQNPNYTFATNGDFPVTLKVSDGVYENVITKNITVIGKSVIVELFTGQWCSNCPNAEEALHNLRMQYGSRFSYVEYHIGDQLAGDFTDIFSYYPNTGTLPLGIVNGNAHIVYSAPCVEEVQTEIETAIIPLLQEPISVLLSDLQINLTDTLLTTSVQIELDPSISTDNLSLVAVLMEDYNEDYPNHHGDPHHNIVLKRITVDISTFNLDNPVNFEIDELDVLPQWYMDNATGLPEDLTLMIWIQTLETPYNQNSCAVHNVIEVSL